MNLERFLDEKVEYARFQIQMYTDELKNLPEGKLWTEVRSEQLRYYCAICRDGRWKRSIINGNRELLALMARKEYLDTTKMKSINSPVTAEIESIIKVKLL